MILRALAPLVLMLAAAWSMPSGDVPESSVVTAARPLPFFYDLYTFRGDDGGTDVVVSVAVEARRLQRERIQGMSRYRFDLRFVLADTLLGSVSNTEDSVYLTMPSPLLSRHLVHTYVELQAPPSETTLQRLVVTDATRPGTGQLYTSPFRIPDYSGRALMLSDIAFGLPGATSGWTRRGVTLGLLPTSQFPESSFDVYYEVYNLPAGIPYETEMSIQPLDGDGDEDGRAVRTTFSGESTASEDGTLAELRRIESALPKGQYRFTVNVRDRISGASVEQSRDFEVQEWGGGATMVEAMPYKAEG